MDYYDFFPSLEGAHNFCVSHRSGREPRVDKLTHGPSLSSRHPKRHHVFQPLSPSPSPCCVSLSLSVSLDLPLSLLRLSLFLSDSCGHSESCSHILADRASKHTPHGPIQARDSCYETQITSSNYLLKILHRNGIVNTSKNQSLIKIRCHQHTHFGRIA